MKNKIIYIDFDGVIIDNSYKLYAIYKKLMTGKKILSENEYWNLKKMQILEEEIVKKSFNNDAFISNYTKRRLELIESEEYLKYDKIIDGVIGVIKKLKEKNKIVLTTRRCKKDTLFKQLKRLNLLNVFDAVLIPEGKTKENLILEDSSFDKEDSIIIGDTEEDVIAGKKLGIKTIAVLSGIRCKKYLKNYNPDVIIKDISNLPNLEL